jgi:hypothetical protein
LPSPSGAPSGLRPRSPSGAPSRALYAVSRKLRQSGADQIAGLPQGSRRRLNNFLPYFGGAAYFPLAERL